MRQFNNITISQKALVTAVSRLIFFLAGSVFIFTVFSNFIQPFFLASNEQTSGITLDSAIDDIGNSFQKRRDLTANTSSATLIEEENIATFSGVESSPSGENIEQ